MNKFEVQESESCFLCTFMGNAKVFFYVHIEFTFPKASSAYIMFFWLSKKLRIVLLHILLSGPIPVLISCGIITARLLWFIYVFQALGMALMSTLFVFK